MAAPNTTDVPQTNAQPVATSDPIRRRQSSLKSWKQMPLVVAVVYATTMVITIVLLWSPQVSRILAQNTAVPTAPVVVATPGSAEATLTESEAQQLLQWMERVSQNADTAISGANTVLGGIQALGVFIAVISTVIAFSVTIAGFIGFRRLVALDTELDEQVKNLESRVDKRIEPIVASGPKLEGLQLELTPYLSKLSIFNEKSEKLEQLEKDITAKLQRLEQESRDSLEALTLLQIGLKEFNYGNRSLAISQIRKAYKLSPVNQAVTYTLGELLTRYGENSLDEGIEKLTEALNRDPDDPSVNAALGYAYRVYGDLVNADQSLPEAIRQERSKEQYAKSLAFYEAARKHGDYLHDITGESAFGGLAGLYKRQGDRKTAIYWYGKIAENTPGRSYPLNNLALLYDEDGDFEKSKVQFEKSKSIAARNLSLNADDYWCCFDLVTANTALNQAEDATYYLEYAFQLTPGKVDIGKLADGIRSLQPREDREELKRKILARIAEWLTHS